MVQNMQYTPFSLHTNDIKPSTRVHCNPKRPPKDFLHGPPVVSPIFSNPEASGSWTLASGLWANHYGPSGHAPFLPSRNTTESHSAPFCNFCYRYITQASGIGRILSAPVGFSRFVCCYRARVYYYRRERVRIAHVLGNVRYCSC